MEYPIGLAKQAQGRACLAVMVSFLTWNYFINAMGMTWGSYFGVDFTQDAVAGSGLTMMAGIKTLDTSIIGAIIISFFRCPKKFAFVGCHQSRM